MSPSSDLCLIFLRAEVWVLSDLTRGMSSTTTRKRDELYSRRSCTAPASSSQRSRLVVVVVAVTVTATMAITAAMIKLMIMMTLATISVTTRPLFIV